MRAGFIMLFLCFFVLGLFLAVTDGPQRKILSDSVAQIGRKADIEISVIWDKLNGIKPFYITQEEEDSCEYTSNEECSQVAEGEVFDGDTTLNVETKWDGKYLGSIQRTFSSCIIE